MELPRKNIRSTWLKRKWERHLEKNSTEISRFCSHIEMNMQCSTFKNNRKSGNNWNLEIRKSMISMILREIKLKEKSIILWILKEAPFKSLKKKLNNSRLLKQICCLDFRKHRRRNVMHSVNWRIL